MIPLHQITIYVSETIFQKEYKTLTLATDYKIKVQKLQYDIEASKIRELSHRKIDKYEYLRGKEILLSDQRQMIEQARFTNSPLGKYFEKKINKND